MAVRESFGLVNYVISQLGGTGPKWQTDADLSLMVVVFAGAWAGTAFSMLLFISALRNVPRSLKEAAALDGATAWQTFRHVTMPSIRPTSFMVILLATLGAMKEFAMVQAVNGGGPGTANNLIVQYIYTTGFSRAKIGYASAASMILLVILLVLSLAQLYVNNRREAQ
ncbi:carbohydrate ABC transporter permease [Actinomyces ruminis]|uniref:carbohydrate ABC transporter permease n=1 Tax=Actinomyces ruminis TaxID=1937003 RepID=UPI00211F2C54|nr:sugar ABC transporter permease [Actinomyces ruminis]